MASHVFVIDSAARRTQIKTSPATYLRDVLEQACKAKGLNADQYELKQGNKVVDLSLSIRLSGLSSGAKLDLVQSSRTPSVISIALQLPDSDGSKRLTDKFPSNTSLWQILRRFESGAAGQGQSTSKTTYNFTQRGTTQLQNGVSGAGRIYYDMPVIFVLGRELGTLPDLQKTLGQLGLNKGSSLLRLSFKNTGEPIEEVMIEISEFFIKEGQASNVTTVEDSRGQIQSASSPEAESSHITEALASVPSTSSVPSSEPPASFTSPASQPENTQAPPASSDPEPTNTASATSIPDGAPPTTDTSPLTAPDSRPLTIFRPPTSSTPHAALATHNAADYEPTIDHAKSHQAVLAAASRPSRLPSDAEVVSRAQSAQDALARIAAIDVVVRLPDQSRVQARFTQDDTVASLYGFVRGLMELAGEPFELKWMDDRARLRVLREGEEWRETLIRGLGMRNRTLVSLVWGDGASARTREVPVLKGEWRERAKALEVEDKGAGAVQERGEMSADAEGGKLGNEGIGKERKGKEDIESKMKKFLGFKKK
ncbi:MAG: hypothetical protein Q9165_001694 [Trypethelium subeluteriae]